MNKKEKIKKILDEAKKHSNIKIDPEGRGKNVYRLKNNKTVSDEIVERLYKKVLELKEQKELKEKISVRTETPREKKEDFSEQQAQEQKTRERRRVYERLNWAARQRWHAVTVGNRAAAEQLNDEVNKLLDYLEENI